MVNVCAIELSWEGELNSLASLKYYLFVEEIVSAFEHNEVLQWKYCIQPS